METNLTDNNRSWLWTLALTIALGILAAFSFNKVWPNTSSGWIIWLGIAAGGVGGLVHEFGQSGGKILFLKREEDGIYLGAFAGMFMGMIAGALSVQGLFNQTAATTTQSPLAVEALYTAFLAGLALKGFAEAVGGQPITGDADSATTGSGAALALPAIPTPPKIT